MRTTFTVETRQDHEMQQLQFRGLLRQNSRYHSRNQGDLATDNPHHDMKKRIYGVLHILIPALVFGAIIHDGLTLQTANHSGTQNYNISNK